MLHSVFARTVAERRRAAVIFSLAALAVTAMYIGVFPSFQAEMAGYADALPEAMRAFMGDDFASPAGYLQSTIFTILGPVLLVSAAVSWGAAVIAGEEEERTLPLVLAAPLSRTRLAAAKGAGVAAMITVLAVVLLASILLWVEVHDLGIPPARVLAAVAHLHGLALLAGALAFGVGAATGRKSPALSSAIGVVVGGFVLSGVTALVDGLQPLRWASPFFWFNGSEPIRNGVDWLRLALLYGCALLASAAGIRRFSRRDLR